MRVAFTCDPVSETGRHRTVLERAGKVVYHAVAWWRAVACNYSFSRDASVQDELDWRAAPGQVGGPRVELLDRRTEP